MGQAPKKSLLDQTRKKMPKTPEVTMNMAGMRKKEDEKVSTVEGVIGTHIMIMTEDGWKPLNIQKKRLSR